MRVELAFFDGDELLSRNELLIDIEETVSSFPFFTATPKLGDGSATIVLSGFPQGHYFKEMTLDMPIHESTDWETLDFDRYILAFWCKLNS